MTEASYRANPLAHGDFRVGAVISRAVSILFRNFPAFFLVMLVASLPSVLSSGPLAPQDQVTRGAVAGIAGLLVLLLNLVGQAVILYATVQDMRGRPAALGEMLGRGLSRFFPLLGLLLGVLVAVLGLFFILTLPSTLVAATGTIGTLFAVVASVNLLAAVIVFCAFLLMWAVAVPVCVVERLGPFRSLGRSQRLTKGYRWRLLGLGLLLILVDLVAAVVFLLLMFAINSFIGIGVTEVLANVVWTAFAGVVYAVPLAVTYHDLRVAKEGVDAEQIAAVFD